MRRLELQPEPLNTRLDKWLWAARFYKTRVLATTAVAGGKVQLQGQRVKPSRNVKLGDEYDIQRGQERFQITVLGLSGRRGSATIAQALYQESAQSIEQRLLAAEKRKLAALQFPPSSHRPNKQERRKIRQFSGKD